MYCITLSISVNFIQQKISDYIIISGNTKIIKEKLYVKWVENIFSRTELQNYKNYFCVKKQAEMTVKFFLLLI